MLRMIEPLLTSCQKGPFSPVRLVGSGLLGRGELARAAPSFFSSFGVGKH